MEKQIKNILAEFGEISTEIQKLITSMIILKKGEIDIFLEEKTKKMKEKSAKKVSDLEQKIKEERENLALKIEEEKENLIKKEINSHLKYLGVSVKKEEEQKVFEQETVSGFENMNRSFGRNY